MLFSLCTECTANECVIPNIPKISTCYSSEFNILDIWKEFDGWTSSSPIHFRFETGQTCFLKCNLCWMG